jgi:hypothetical protein
MNNPIGKVNDLPMRFKQGSDEKALVNFENCDENTLSHPELF